MTLDRVMIQVAHVRISQQFGEAVTQLLKDQGNLSLQGARLRTGIDHNTLSRMKQGEVPRVDKVLDFARGFGLDVNEWLELAGYEPVEETNVERMAERVVEHARGDTALRGYLYQSLHTLGLALGQVQSELGQEPIESGAMILDAGLYRLSQRTGEFIARSGAIPRDKLTPEQARKELVDLEEQLREQGLLKD